MLLPEEQICKLYKPQKPKTLDSNKSIKFDETLQWNDFQGSGG